MRKGQRHSEDSKEKNRKAHLGKITWNKGKKIGFIPKCAFKKGNPAPKTAFKKGQKPWNKGIPNFNGRGEKCHLWRGGISTENNKIRGCIEYRLWREAVFARDSWTCQKTKIIGCRLVAHHINNFADYPELRTSIENGITLSKDSHDKFHKKYGKRNNTREQLIEFLKQ
jgi:hypothetical protein